MVLPHPSPNAFPPFSSPSPIKCSSCKNLNRKFGKSSATMFLPRPSMSGLLPLVPGQGMKSRRSLILLCATLLYLVAGALLFSLFEYEEDLRARRELANQRREMQQKYGFTKKDFAELEQVVVQSIPLSAGFQWKFLGSLYFCTVVITTIGYGHSTPNTIWGRLFCMFYALGGIPLGLVTFQSVGERINHCIKIMLQRLDGWSRKRGLRLMEWLGMGRPIKSRHLLCVSFSIGCITIAVATGVFHQLERWSIFDAAYYCMITLSTIGFGDFVPAQTMGRLGNEPIYVLFILFFILFGLAIFSACINLLILECMAYNADIVTARARLKRMISIRMSTSFRIVTGQNGIHHQPKIRRGRVIRRREKPQMERKTGVIVEKLDGQQQQRRRRSSYSISLLAEIYRRYYWSEPAHFCVRRLPTPYIEHLVKHSEEMMFPKKDSEAKMNQFVVGNL